ncbi:MAG: hypothetical protein AB2A00_38425 [Myxococcota bacterium]
MAMVTTCASSGGAPPALEDDDEPLDDSDELLDDEEVLDDQDEPPEDDDDVLVLDAVPPVPDELLAAAPLVDPELVPVVERPALLDDAADEGLLLWADDEALELEPVAAADADEELAPLDDDEELLVPPVLDALVVLCDDRLTALLEETDELAVALPVLPAEEVPLDDEEDNDAPFSGAATPGVSSSG